MRPLKLVLGFDTAVYGLETRGDSFWTRTSTRVGERLEGLIIGKKLPS